MSKLLYNQPKVEIAVWESADVIRTSSFASAAVKGDAASVFSADAADCTGSAEYPVSVSQ